MEEGSKVGRAQLNDLCPKVILGLMLIKYQSQAGQILTGANNQVSYRAKL